MTQLQFTGETDADLEVVRELLNGIPASSRLRAKAVATRVENVVTNIMKSHPNDPAAGLGLAFAVFTIAQRLTQTERHGPKSQRLIHTLGD